MNLIIVILEFQFKVEPNKSGGDVMYDINLTLWFPVCKFTFSVLYKYRFFVFMISVCVTVKDISSNKNLRYNIYK